MPCPTSKDLSELPSVKDTIDNAREELQLCRRSWDDPHRKSDGYSGPPRVECDFTFLSSRVHLASPGFTIFSMIDKESQSMAAALSVKAASDLLVRCFLAMLDAWRRSDVKVLFRSDQEVTLLKREMAGWRWFISLSAG